MTEENTKTRETASRTLDSLGPGDLWRLFDVHHECGPGPAKVWEYQGTFDAPGCDPSAHRFKDADGWEHNIRNPGWRVRRYSPIRALASRLDDDGPIYATIAGPASTPCLFRSESGPIMFAMENRDVGGGEECEVTAEFALAFAAQFGGTGETP